MLLDASSVLYMATINTSTAMTAALLSLQTTTLQVGALLHCASLLCYLASLLCLSRCGIRVSAVVMQNSTPHRGSVQWHAQSCRATKDNYCGHNACMRTVKWHDSSSPSWCTVAALQHSMIIPVLHLQCYRRLIEHQPLVVPQQWHLPHSSGLCISTAHSQVHLLASSYHPEATSERAHRIINNVLNEYNLPELLQAPSEKPT